MAALSMLACLALAACAPGASRGDRANAPAGDDDPFVTSGSVDVGARRGAPTGPYSPR